MMSSSSAHLSGNYAGIFIPTSSVMCRTYIRLDVSLMHLQKASHVSLLLGVYLNRP